MRGFDGRTAVAGFLAVRVIESLELSGILPDLLLEFPQAVAQVAHAVVRLTTGLFPLRRATDRLSPCSRSSRTSFGLSCLDIQSRQLLTKLAGLFAVSIADIVHPALNPFPAALKIAESILRLSRLRYFKCRSPRRGQARTLLEVAKLSLDTADLITQGMEFRTQDFGLFAPLAATPAQGRLRLLGLGDQLVQHPLQDVASARNGRRLRRRRLGDLWFGSRLSRLRRLRLRLRQRHCRNGQDNESAQAQGPSPADSRVAALIPHDSVDSRFHGFLLPYNRGQKRHSSLR